MKSRQADDSRRNVAFPTITLAGNESINAGTVTTSGAVGLEQAMAAATDARSAKGFNIIDGRYRPNAVEGQLTLHECVKQFYMKLVTA